MEFVQQITSERTFTVLCETWNWLVWFANKNESVGISLEILIKRMNAIAEHLSLIAVSACISCRPGHYDTFKKIEEKLIAFVYTCAVHAMHQLSIFFAFESEVCSFIVVFIKKKRTTTKLQLHIGTMLQEKNRMRSDLPAIRWHSSLWSLNLLFSFGLCSSVLFALCFIHSPAFAFPSLFWIMYFLFCTPFSLFVCSASALTFCIFLTRILRSCDSCFLIKNTINRSNANQKSQTGESAQIA